MEGRDLALLFAGLAGGIMYLLLILVLNCRRKPSPEEAEHKFRLLLGADGLGLIWEPTTTKPVFGQLFGNTQLERRLMKGQTVFTQEELDGFAIQMPVLLAGGYVEVWDPLAKASTYYFPVHDGGLKIRMANKLQRFARGRALRRKMEVSFKAAQLQKGEEAAAQPQPLEQSHDAQGPAVTSKEDTQDSPIDSNRSIFDALLERVSDVKGSVAQSSTVVQAV
jgi:hypothetical protein